jgi:cytoskeletal protein CcmA (bactofilin family)
MWLRGRSRYEHVLQASFRLNGAMSFEGGLLFEGVLNGPLTSTAKKSEAFIRGQVVGDVQAETVYIEGTVTGNVTAQTLVIQAKGKLIGNARVRTLHLAEGGSFNGTVETQMVSPTTVTTKELPAIGSASVAKQRLEQVQAGDRDAIRSA